MRNVAKLGSGAFRRNSTRPSRARTSARVATSLTRERAAATEAAEQGTPSEKIAPARTGAERTSGSDSARSGSDRSEGRSGPPSGGAS